MFAGKILYKDLASKHK